MSGLLALFDDVAAIARMAATQVDDVLGQAAKAGSKAAGAVIDDAAVTPKYVRGFEPSRELPIVGKIALGSIRNKLLILLPLGILMSQFAPWAIPPLLMLGGAYLCFEGAEKIWHAIAPGEHHHADQAANAPLNPVHLEEQKVRGAIKTDFILSAEIMTIALAAIEVDNVWYRAVVLAVVAILITAVVYGSVALIVKADDLGVLMSLKGRLRLTRSVGRAIVKGMPFFLTALTIIGTAAMLWVGGNIIVHALHELGWDLPYDTIHDAAVAVAGRVSEGLQPAVEWIATAAMDGVLGVLIGLAIIPVAKTVLAPILRWMSGATSTEGAH